MNAMIVWSADQKKILAAKFVGISGKKRKLCHHIHGYLYPLHPNIGDHRWFTTLR